MIQNASSKKMIDLDIKEVIFAVKIIDLNAEISTEKVMVVFIFEINCVDIYIAMTLVNQNTIVLFHIIILVFEI